MVVDGGGGGGVSSDYSTTIMVVLLLGLWLLLGCGNDYFKNWQIDGSVKISRELIITGFCAEKILVNYYIYKYI